MSASPSPPCSPTNRYGRRGAGPQGVSSATFYNRFRRYLHLAALPPSGHSRPTPHRRQAPPRRRRVGRVRKPVPRPQLARRHHHLSPQTRRSTRSGLARRRQRYRRELIRRQHSHLALSARRQTPPPPSSVRTKLSLRGSVSTLLTPLSTGCRSALTSSRLQSVHTSNCNPLRSGGPYARSHRPHRHLRPRQLRRAA